MSSKNGKPDLGRADTILSFLRNPLDRSAQRPFIDLCYLDIMACLRLWRSRGRRLPVNQVQGENTIRDIAFDILGHFLRCDRGRPYWVIFEFFERHGIADFENLPDDRLNSLFAQLIRGFTSRCLTDLMGDHDPQLANLKRRIDDVLRTNEYRVISIEGVKGQCVVRTGTRESRLEGSPMIGAEELYRLAYDAFIKTTNRAEWCRRIFELVELGGEFASAVPVAMLKSVMVAINAEYADVAGLALGHVWSPREAYLRHRIAEAADAALRIVSFEQIDRFIAKGRLDASDRSIIIDTCRLYLIDHALDGSTDSLPTYFRMLRPDISQEEYLQQYKFVIDTVIGQAKDILRDTIEKDPTIDLDGVH